MTKLDRDRLPISESSFGGPFVFSFLFIVLAFIDQYVKYLIFHYGFSFPPRGGFGIVQFKNFNFVFSLPIPQALIFTIYFVVLVIAITYVAKKNHSFFRQEAIAWGIIFTGAFLNIAERVFLGYVRDFLYIGSGIFNFADAYIIIGIVLLLGQWKNYK